jgi:hypothetical protein
MVRHGPHYWEGKSGRTQAFIRSYKSSKTTNEILWKIIGEQIKMCGIDNIVFSGGLTLGPLLVGHLMEKIGSGNTNAVFAGICGLTMVVTGIYKGRTKGNLDDRADQDG